MMFKYNLILLTRDDGPRYMVHGVKCESLVKEKEISSSVRLENCVSACKVGRSVLTCCASGGHDGCVSGHRQTVSVSGGPERQVLQSSAILFK